MKLVPINHAKYKLFVSGIEKQFGSTKALSNAIFHLKSGEIHALMGENGAGKSTLIKILSGYYAPDGGKIYYKAKPYIFRSPTSALEEGICVVHQELSLFDDLSVVDNLFPNNIERSRLGLNWKVARQKALEALEIVGLHSIQPNTLVKSLGIAKKQLIEIARAIYQDASILILDEPTSSLDSEDTQNLFKILNILKKQEKAIIFVSHKIDEVLKICDRITIFKDGKYSGTILNRAHFDNQNIRNEIIRLMVGRQLSQKYQKHLDKGSLILEVKGLKSKHFDDINFSLRQGEILGLVGLVGSGRSALCRAIFGATSYESGEIYYKGKTLAPHSIQRSIQSGIAMIPEDRHQMSLFHSLSISYNINILLYKKFIKKGFFHSSLAHSSSEHNKTKFCIKMGTPDAEVGSLSGGNQQKCILARWLSYQPDCIIFDEPTHGIDIGAKAEIYDLLHFLAIQGKAILLISSELQEILAICDRVAVMKEGKITKILARSEMSEENLLKFAI